MVSTNYAPTSREWKLPGAAPRFATPPDPTRPNAGARVAAIAAMLGRPLMPWQQYVADVATERLDDGSYAYPVVVVTVPRQSGKTLLLGAVLAERCITSDDHQALYTAQTGKDARERWRDLVKLVMGSPLRELVRIRRSQGSERMEFPDSGSMLGVFAPTVDSLHGYTPPTVCLDEAYAHSEDEGDALMAAIEPAQQTLPHRQVWIVSTRGTALSVFLHGWIERGRGGSPGVALFDWGAREDQDPRDPVDLMAFHPALGLPDGLGNGTTPERILASKLSPSAYERAYGNRETVTESHTIPAGAWADLASDQAPPGDAPLTLTYDLAYDRSAASIGVSWRDADGKLQHKLIRWQLGVAWVAEEVADLADRWHGRVAAVASDDTGPAREVTDQLRKLQLRGPAADPRILTSRELTVAWGELLEGIRTHGFGHCGDGHLADAAAAVVPRPVLDAFAPSRRYSPGDIAPLMTAVVGLYVAAHAAVQDQTPQLRFA